MVNMLIISTCIWQALLSAISKRIKGFMRLRTAMTTLQGALPDATQDELLAYEDDCAICKVRAYTCLRFAGYWVVMFFRIQAQHSVIFNDLVRFNSILGLWNWQEPMARAKRLPCAHLFHLACLRSWYIAQSVELFEKCVL